LDNQISNNQSYIARQGQPTQQQFQAKQNPSQDHQSYGGAKEVAKNNTNAGYIASKFDVMQHPWLLVQNVLLGLGTAVGITRVGEYLVRGDLKKLPDDISVAKALEQSPLYKFGKKMDAFIEKTPFLKKSVDQINKWTEKIGNTPKSPEVQRIIDKFKEGLKVTWPPGKFYEEGKGSEAFDETVDFLEKSPEGTFKDATKDLIDDTIKAAKDEKISRSRGGKKIIEAGLQEEKHLHGLSAKYIDGVKIGAKNKIGVIFDNIFGTTPNLYSSIAKSKFFNDLTPGLGPVSKLFNKISLMMLEATGGGLLGGKMATIGSVVGLISAFNACSKANVAKKEKQKQLEQGNLTPEQLKEVQKRPWSGEMVSGFMEDFAGFTLGGYLMTFPLGVAVNKYLGLSNLGRDDKSIQSAATQMGIQGDKHLYQRSIIKYNEAIKNDKIARKYLKSLETGKLSLFKSIKKTLGFNVDESLPSKVVEKLKLKDVLGISSKATDSEIAQILQSKSKSEIITALKSKLQTDDWFKTTREMLKKTGKTQLTLKSISKETDFNKGSFGRRLGKYILQKPLELSAKILGFEKFLMYKHNAKVTNKFRSLIRGGGGIGRIILVGMVMTVPFRNAFMQISHKIFGKPSFSQYDEVKGVYEDKEEATKETSQEAATAPQNEFKKIKLPEQPPMQMLNSQPKIAPTSLNLNAQEPIATPNPYQNQIKVQDNYSYIPKNEIAEKDETNKSVVRKLDTYTHIPGQ